MKQIIVVILLDSSLFDYKLESYYHKVNWIIFKNKINQKYTNKYGWIISKIMAYNIKHGKMKW